MISCCYSGPEGAGKLALVQDGAWFWFFPDSLEKGGVVLQGPDKTKCQAVSTPASG